MGGLLGDFVKAAIFWLYYSFIHTEASGYLDNPSATILFAVLGIPSAILFGIIITAIVSAIKLKSGRRIGILGGAAIGVGLIGASVAILLFLPIRGLPVDNWFSWAITASFVGDFGIIIGAVAGMTAGHKNRVRFQ
jgi:hypothetical protein